MLYCLQNAEALDQQICLIGHIIWVWVYLFPPAAFQLGFRKKQADASVWPAISRLPSIVLEVGDSESLTQLKFDARLWFEHMLEVSQFLPLLPLTHWNFFRYSWSSFFWSTSPLPPTQIFWESPSNCGEALPPFTLHTHQQLGRGKPTWSGKLTGLILQHHCTYYFLTSSGDRCLQLMVTMITCIWIL